ncbi:endonuclease domain-containing protein [uncultured Brevundimonas sp.]|uniref:endonuclease domain-containing protein n=1 Tax=uncultured Brevundimonas sp. TaxID=213418 RepID=UPI0030EC8432|tara:strand:- start:26593 stop:26964 length:372 start_codon:yes stop_codon:yes gene_type:complete
MEAPELTVRRARELRRRMSLPEVLVWQAIRGGKLGVRFRRQHPVGPWILDFYCHARRLAVEIDGTTHDHPDRVALDHRRTVWLQKRGIQTLRIAASEVLGNLDGVLEGLKARVEAGHALPEAD